MAVWDKTLTADAIIRMLAIRGLKESGIAPIELLVVKYVKEPEEKDAILAWLSDALRYIDRNPEWPFMTVTDENLF